MAPHKLILLTDSADLKEREKQGEEGSYTAQRSCPSIKYMT